jgi:hypothetical protein
MMTSSPESWKRQISIFDSIFWKLHIAAAEVRLLLEILMSSQLSYHRVYISNKPHHFSANPKLMLLHFFKQDTQRADLVFFKRLKDHLSTDVVQGVWKVGSHISEHSTTNVFPTQL